ncbi:MAG TPA: hypothetical protein VL859_09645 [Flavobacterium sp.]|nr:hypothetical protein [Flavobacterium sp.]
MKNRIEIDGTNDAVWNSDGARATWNIATLLTIKKDLKIGDSSLITLPTDNVDNIVNNVLGCLKFYIINFEENFTYTVNFNTIELTRIANNEYYKIDI